MAPPPRLAASRLREGGPCLLGAWEGSGDRPEELPLYT